MKAFSESIARQRGFTIVELLIVIVVIAILAAISIVAYTGIRDRGVNASILNQANQAQKLMAAYMATYGDYPLKGTVTNTPSCISDPCQWGSTIPTLSQPDPVLKANLEKIGTLPKDLPQTNSVLRGIAYSYAPARTVDGVLAPAILLYGLQGSNQRCNPGKLIDTVAGTALTVSTPYSVTDSPAGSTTCVISLPAP